MSGIIWLASYPKSGSTWFRIFLLNLLRDAEGAASINDLVDNGPSKIASSRVLFDHATGFDSSDLTESEIAQLRPAVYHQLASRSDQTVFMKIHDANRSDTLSRCIASFEATQGVLYFIRSPLDVAVSWSNHTGRDIDAIIRRMADESLVLCPEEGGLSRQLRQHVLSWSDHVTSWMDWPQTRVHLVRYEDMKLRPLATFARAATFAGLESAPEQIEEALGLSGFSEQQRQEREGNFKERFSKSTPFFRSGEIGQWRTELTPNQTARIVRDHGQVMQRFGYLDADGEIVH